MYKVLLQLILQLSQCPLEGTVGRKGLTHIKITSDYFLKLCYENDYLTGVKFPTRLTA